MAASPTLQAVEDYKRSLLEKMVKHLTAEQKIFYEKLFPDGPRADQFNTAVGLLERTIGTFDNPTPEPPDEKEKPA
jgi:hypothetical protein